MVEERMSNCDLNQWLLMLGAFGKIILMQSVFFVKNAEKLEKHSQIQREDWVYLKMLLHWIVQGLAASFAASASSFLQCLY